MRYLLHFPKQSNFSFLGFIPNKVGDIPNWCDTLPRLVLLVAVVEFDGRLPYRRKQHSLALLLGTKVLSLARVCAERRLFLHL